MMAGRLLPLIAALLATLACASTNLDVADDHPANYRAATAPLSLPKPLAAAGESRTPDEAPAMPAGHRHHGSEPMAPAKTEAPPPAPATAPSGSARPKTAETWTCPMHPQIVRNEPGKCPICGMTLVKSSKSHEGAH